MAAKTAKKPQDHKRKQPRNEAAVEQLADILEPVVTIFSDPEVKAQLEDENRQIVKIIVFILRKYARELIQTLASLDGIAYEDADYTTGEIIQKCLSITQNEELMVFLSSLR